MSNLTTFLNLVLTAGPDTESGVSSRAAVSQLKQAADALLRHVKPPQDAVSDAALKLLVDLKCQVRLLPSQLRSATGVQGTHHSQTFIAAASTSRTAVDPVPYFSAPLSSHLPHAASIAMTDRAASVKFSTMQATALSTIQSTEGDWLVLRTKWTWEATAREARDWVESVVIESGLGASAVAQQEEEGALAETRSLSAGQPSSTGGSPPGQVGAHPPSTSAPPTSDDQFEAGGDAEDEDDLFGTQAALQRQSQAIAAAQLGSEAEEQDELSSSSSPDEQEELVIERVEEVVEFEANGSDESEEQLIVGPAEEADLEDQLEDGDGAAEEGVDADGIERTRDEQDQVSLGCEEMDWEAGLRVTVTGARDV